MMLSLLTAFHYQQCVKALLLASFLVTIGFTAVRLIKNDDVAPSAWISKRNRMETVDLTQYRSTESPSSSTVVNVVLPGSFRVRNETFNCKTTQLIGLSFPICLYNQAADIHVSGALLRGDYFERGVVSRFMRLLQGDHRLQLVDIGANIGIYSLPAARLTHVIAVEPNWHSMARLARAVDLGTVSSNITLVHNAVSDVRTRLKMGVDPNNQGHAFLINGTKCKSTLEWGSACNTLKETTTVLLNDLLPLMRSNATLIKVDVEGHELNVFTESSAGQFFNKIDVPLVFMEWMFCKKSSPAIVQRLLDFFHKRNYGAYGAFHTGSSRLQHQRYRSWPNNILFKKLPYKNFRFKL